MEVKKVEKHKTGGQEGAYVLERTGTLERCEASDDGGQRAPEG